MTTNQLSTITQITSRHALTMSSREIATLCDKEHRNVCRDIENLNLEYEKLSLLKIEQCEYVADNRQTYREFLLTKEQTIDLITGYRADLRIRINRRWQELEQSATISDPLLLIAQMATQAYEAKQLAMRQEQRLCGVEQRVDVAIAKAQAVLDDDGYFSVKGFSSLHNVRLTNSQMSALSRKCKKLSEVKDVPHKEIKDPRWGKVKIYHKDILAEVFKIDGYLDLQRKSKDL